MASTFTIDGAEVSLVANSTPVAVHGIELNQLALSLDEYDVLTFSQRSGTFTPAYGRNKMVELTIDGFDYPHFRGRIVRHHWNFDKFHGWTIGYTCLGLKYLGNRISVTNENDFSGHIVFNRHSRDPLYDPGFSRLEVGEMLKIVFDMHQDALADYGIAGYVQADLDNLTVVPPEPAFFQGPHLFNACEMVLSRWQGNHVLRVAWDQATEDWRIRIINTLALTERDLTFGVDPIDPDTLDIDLDIADCYTQTILRGEHKVKLAILSVLNGTLAPNWTSDAQEDWNWAAFASPDGLISEGNVITLTAGSASVDPTRGDESWDSNEWADKQARIVLINPVASGIDFSETREVSGNTALSAGSTGEVYWTGDDALITSGYSKYHLIASTNDEDGEAYNPLFPVWREYIAVPDYVRDHLGLMFPEPVPFGTASAKNLIQYPAALIFWGIGDPDYYEPVDNQFCGPLPFEIDRYRGVFRFQQPVVTLTTSQEDLDAGGDAVAPPYDIWVAVPYYVGILTAKCPSSLFEAYGYGEYSETDIYSGTAYTVDGLAEAWYEDADGWHHERNRPEWEIVACMVHDTHKDITVSGSLTYLGKWDDGLDLDTRLNIKCEELGVPTAGPWDEIKAPVRRVTLQWPAGGGTTWQTSVSFSNRRQIATGIDAIVHPNFQSDSYGLISPFLGGGGYGFNEVISPMFGNAAMDPFSAMAQQGSFVPASAEHAAFVQGIDPGLVAGRAPYLPGFDSSMPLPEFPGMRGGLPEIASPTNVFNEMAGGLAAQIAGQFAAPVEAAMTGAFHLQPPPAPDHDRPSRDRFRQGPGRDAAARDESRQREERRQAIMEANQRKGAARRQRAFEDRFGAWEPLIVDQGVPPEFDMGEE